MEEDIKTTINRIIMELAEGEGEVLPIKQIVNLAKEEGIKEEEVLAEIKALINEGVLTHLDETSVQVDM
ncbi:MAG: hypothetical protein KJ574_00330 [Nanoarchaeota archaeon]|nr:hypothetical protein [Nanoarchaeota archaeon]